MAASPGARRDTGNNALKHGPDFAARNRKGAAIPLPRPKTTLRFESCCAARASFSESARAQFAYAVFVFTSAGIGTNC